MIFLNNLIKTDKINDNAKVVWSFLFQRWLSMIAREERYDWILLPSQKEIADKTGNSRQNIKEILDVLVQAGFLHLNQKSPKKIYYLLSMLDNDGNFTEITDHSQYEKNSKCSAAWQQFGYYVKVDDDIVASHELTSTPKVILAAFIGDWTDSEGKQWRDICYYSTVTKRYPCFSTEQLKHAMKVLTSKGIVEKELATFRNYKGFTNLKFNTAKILLKINETSADEILKNTEEVEEAVSKLPDTMSELKMMILERTNNIKEKAAAIAAASAFTREILSVPEEEKEELKMTSCEDEAEAMLSGLPEEPKPRSQMDRVFAELYDDSPADKQEEKKEEVSDGQAARIKELYDNLSDMDKMIYNSREIFTPIESQIHWLERRQQR